MSEAVDTLMQTGVSELLAKERGAPVENEAMTLHFLYLYTIPGDTNRC